MSYTSSTYQGAQFIELFSTQGSNPFEKVRISDKALKHVKKVYDKEVKSFIIDIPAMPLASNSRLIFPKQEKGQLSLLYRYVVLQLLAAAQELHFEITVRDTGQNRRRLIFSSGFRDIHHTPLHTQLPLTSEVLPRGRWANVCIDLQSLVSFAFQSDGIEYQCMDELQIGSICKLRKIFVCAQNPISDVILPQKYQFPGGVDYDAVIIDRNSFDNFLDNQDVSSQNIASEGIGEASVSTPPTSRARKGTTPSASHVAFGRNTAGVAPSNSISESKRSNSPGNSISSNASGSSVGSSGGGGGVPPRPKTVAAVRPNSTNRSRPGSSAAVIRSPPTKPSPPSTQKPQTVRKGEKPAAPSKKSPTTVQLPGSNKSPLQTPGPPTRAATAAPASRASPQTSAQNLSSVRYSQVDPSDFNPYDKRAYESPSASRQDDDIVGLKAAAIRSRPETVAGQSYRPREDQYDFRSYASVDSDDEPQTGAAAAVQTPVAQKRSPQPSSLNTSSSNNLPAKSPVRSVMRSKAPLELPVLQQEQRPTSQTTQRIGMGKQSQENERYSFESNSSSFERKERAPSRQSFGSNNLVDDEEDDAMPIVGLRELRARARAAEQEDVPIPVNRELSRSPQLDEDIDNYYGDEDEELGDDDGDEEEVSDPKMRRIAGVEFESSDEEGEDQVAKQYLQQQEPEEDDFQVVHQARQQCNSSRPSTSYRRSRSQTQQHSVDAEEEDPFPNRATDASLQEEDDFLLASNGSSTRRSSRRSIGENVDVISFEDGDEDDEGQYHHHSRAPSSLGEGVQLIYDEVLGCYYDPKTHQYYEMSQPG